MRQLTLSGIVRRRFLHCVNENNRSVRSVVIEIGIAPGELCRVIAHQNLGHISLCTYYQIAQWLRMSLANVVALAGTRPDLKALVQLGMAARGYRPDSTDDQSLAANEVGVSVAVFRRALHGYPDFMPSIRTCDRFAHWLAWTGFAPDDIVVAAGMIVRYKPDGQRLAVSPDINNKIKPYPCACGRAGCMVPAHIPSGPRRKWRSDACRMWAKRRAERETQPKTLEGAPLPYSMSIVRFIMINERRIPARF